MNSIFKKQFYIQIAIILISFLALGTGLSKIFIKVFINEKKEVLIEQGEKISKSIEKIYYLGTYSTKDLSEEINILNKYLDASFIFVNKNYQITIISNDIDEKWLGETIDIASLNLENNNEQTAIMSSDIDEDTEFTIIEDENVFFNFIGNMGGIFDEEVFTVGYSFFINGNREGIIFMNTSMSKIKATVREIYEKIIVLSLIVIAISFIFIYIFSKKITLPLIEINQNAKVIANGNFGKRINIKSNDEIGQLAQSFNEMAESLFIQEQKRKEFISNISHDIRSPLTSIKGFLQAVLDKTISENNQERYIKIVLEEVERLTTLSNNMLEINKIQFDNTLDYSKFDINELIRLIIIRLESRILQKNISVNVAFSEETTLVNADVEKIQRVVYNLLDNSIKFTEINGEIFIETDLKEEKVIISIKDNGCGIAKENQKMVFDRFYKEDYSRGNDKKGSGLGLSIVKEFILAHNQEIFLESELGKGSKFIFTLERA